MDKTPTFQVRNLRLREVGNLQKARELGLALKRRPESTGFQCLASFLRTLLLTRTPRRDACGHERMTADIETRFLREICPFIHHSTNIS